MDNSHHLSAEKELAERENLVGLLKQLLSDSQQDNLPGLLREIDLFIPWAQAHDVSLAHYLERRSYHKAVAHLESGGDMPHQM